MTLLDRKKSGIFSDKEFNKRLILLTMPIAFQSFMSAAVAAGDSVMLGRLEQNAMSAVSLATQIQFVQNLFLYGFSGASVLLSSQYWGKGDKKTVRNIMCMTLKISVIISVIFFAACELIPEKLMWLFTSEPELIKIGASYLRIAGWSYLLTGISQTYLTIMRVTEHAQASSLISSSSVLINIGLNAVFIFGLLGVKKMGADGAAVATLISRVIELILCLYVSRGRKFVKPNVDGFVHIDKLLKKDYYHQLWPLLGAAMLWGIGFTSYTAAMGHMGTDATAANAVTAVVRDLMCCMCNGVASAGGIIVGKELGKGELEKGKQYGMRTAWISVIIGIVCCFMIIAMIPLVKAFMTLTPEAENYLIGFMVIMGVYMIGRCMNGVMINGVFAAGGDTLFDVYSLAACMWGIAVPMSFLGVFVFHWPPYLVYFFTVFDEMVKIPWVLYHFKKYKWVKDLTR